MCPDLYPLAGPITNSANLALVSIRSRISETRADPELYLKDAQCLLNTSAGLKIRIPPFIASWSSMYSTTTRIRQEGIASVRRL